MGIVDGEAPPLETISKMKKIPGSGLWKPTKLTIVGSICAPDCLRISTNSIAFFGHVSCADSTRATGSRGAGDARFFGRQAAWQAGAHASPRIKPMAVTMEFPLLC